MIALLLAIAAAQVPARAADPDAEACAILRAHVARDATPRQVDAVTRSGGHVLSCPDRTLTFNKSVSVLLSDAPANWRETQQRSWTSFICNGPGFGPMARRGWTFRETFTFRDGARVTSTARC